MHTLTELLHKYDDVLVVIGALAVSLQTIVVTLISVAGLLGKLALYTQTRADDEFFADATLKLGRWHDALQRFQAWLPRARFGKAREPLVGTSIAPPPDAPAHEPAAQPVVAGSIQASTIGTRHSAPDTGDLDPQGPQS